MKDIADCIMHSGLHEFNYITTFFTWKNKSIWSRIDQALHNEFWQDTFAQTQVTYMTQSLSDHTSITLSFPNWKKPKHLFLFHDMWAKDGSFKDIITQTKVKETQSSSLVALQRVLYSLRKPFKQMNKHKYADIYAQQIKAREELS